MAANDRQVAGSHYAGEYQHWDWVFDTFQNYHEARATAYVARYKNKNGLQDLQKGLHFIDKCMELYGNTRERERRHHKDLKYITGDFCAKANLEGDHYLFMLSMVYGHYKQARSLIGALILDLGKTDPKTE